MVRSQSTSSLIDAEGGGAPVLVTRSSNPNPSASDEKVSPPGPDKGLVGENQLASAVRQLGKAKFLAKKEADILNFEELSAVETLLNGLEEEGGLGGQKVSPRLNYEQFCRLREEVPPKARR